MGRRWRAPAPTEGPPSWWGGGREGLAAGGQGQIPGSGARAAGGDREGLRGGEGVGPGAAWPARGWDPCSGSLGAEPQRPDLAFLGRRLEMQGAHNQWSPDGCCPRSLTVAVAPGPCVLFLPGVGEITRRACWLGSLGMQGLSASHKPGDLPRCFCLL